MIKVLLLYFDYLTFQGHYIKLLWYEGCQKQGNNWLPIMNI
jgi:hypothetical protein